MNLRLLPLVLLVSGSVFAQNPKLDSLQRLLKTHLQDTNRIKVNIAIFRSLVFSDPKKAMPFANEALRISQKSDLPKWETSSHLNIGIGYDVQENYAAALETYLIGLKIAEKIPDYIAMASFYNNMANTYRRQKDLDGALKYYQKSLELKQSYAPSDKIGLGHTLNNIAVIYDDKKDYDKALDYYLQALETKQKTKDKQSIGYALANIGTLYLRKKQPEKCIEYQLRAIPLFTEVNEKTGLINIRLALATAYKELGNLPKALEDAEDALRLSQQTSRKSPAAQASKYLSQIYETEKNYEKAFQYLTLQNTYQDSLDTDEDVRKFERLKAGLELEKKELENQALLKDKKIRDAENIALAKDQQIKAGQLQLAQLSLQQQDKISRLEKSRYDYELASKQTENNTLIKDKKIRETELMLKEAVIDRQRIWGITTGLIVLLLGILSLVFYKNYQQKRKDNALLSEQKEAIHQQNIRLEELNSIKDRLFSIISHDFRSPLHSLQGIVGLLQADILSPDETKLALTQLSERLGITLHLLENLLHWAKNQMDGMTVHATTFDLKPVAEESVHLVQIQLAKKQIEIQNQLEAIPVHADKEMINLVIRNLVSNAVKFTKPHGKITLHARPDGQFVYISVQDTGLGIPQENLKRLFTDGTSFTTLGTSNEKGTGLGLSLCKDFVVKNGGDIWVESEAGKGSVFTFTIPASIQS